MPSFSLDDIRAQAFRDEAKSVVRRDSMPNSGAIGERAIRGEQRHPEIGGAGPRLILAAVVHGTARTPPRSARSALSRVHLQQRTAASAPASVRLRAKPL